MKIIVENHKFSYDVGCRLLKLKYENCPMEKLEDIWDDIEPMTFKDIAKLENLEQRRIGMVCLGLDRMVEQVNPILINSKTVEKNTTWINSKGELEETNFKDTYELYKVNGEYFNNGISNSWNRMEDSYYIRFKDTSTDRYYFIWIDAKNVYSTNNGSSYQWKIEDVNAIQCIAWTIQTNVPKGNIKKLIRQGDCVLIKPKGKYEPLSSPRHLTEDEYNTLLVAES